MKNIIFFRKLLYDYTLNNYNEIVAEFPFAYYHGKAIDLDDYLPFIVKKCEFAG